MPVRVNSVGNEIYIVQGNARKLTQTFAVAGEVAYIVNFIYFDVL